VALANPAYGPWKRPVLPSNSATPTFSLHGAANLALTSLTLDYAVQVVHREAVGAAPTVEITDRQPTGRLVFDAPSVADFALVSKAKTGATGALQLVHGGVAGANDGAIVQLDMPKVALASPSYQDADGVWQAQAEYRPLPDGATGNDEVKITTK